MSKFRNAIEFMATITEAASLQLIVMGLAILLGGVHQTGAQAIAAGAVAIVVARFGRRYTGELCYE